MTNPAGRLWENRVIEYLVGVFPNMDRAVKHGRFDKGEFVNTRDWTFECKNTKTIEWAKAIDQAEREKVHNGTLWCAALINRRNHDIDKGYVLMTMRQFRELLIHLEDQ